MPARSAGPRVLVVTAVAAERDAAAGGMMTTESLIGPYPMLTATTAFGRVDLIAGGVGPAASAAATASTLAAAPYDLVMSAGIGGGFGPVAPGDTVVASVVVHADLGADSSDGFLPADSIGLGPVRTELDAGLVAALSDRCAARTGAVLTVSTVTGTRRGADVLLARHPDAVAEAMEGAGVLVAAAARGIPVAEIRTISNRVGTRDRLSWQLGPALSALSTAIAAVVAQPLGWKGL